MPIPQTHARPSQAAPDNPLPAPAGRATVGGVLAIAPNQPFLMAHHRDNWDAVRVDGRSVLVPHLQEITVMAGCVGGRTVSQDEDPTESYSVLVQNLRRKGFAVLFSDQVTVDGETGYYRSHACRDPKNRRGGYYWTSRFDSPKYRMGASKQKFTRDRPAFNAWALRLVELGYIDPPDPSIVQAKLGRLEYHRDRHEAETGLAESSKAQIVASLSERIEALREVEVPSVGDSEIGRLLRSLTVPVLKAMAGPIGKGKRKEQLVALLTAAEVTAEDIRAATDV